MDERTFTTVGTTIRRIRHERKLSMRELAAKAKMDAGYLSRVERNESLPSFKMLGKISRALGVTEWQIVQVSEVIAAALDPLQRKVFDILGITVRENK